jgi:hypothetical protein
MSWKEENGPAPYDEATCQISYDMDYGLLQIPVAGKDGEYAEIVKVSAGWGTKTIKWVMERTGAKPKAPDPEPDNSKEFLVRTIISPYSVILTANGVKRYRLEGIYIYALRLPYNHTTDLPMGKSPYSDESPTENIFKPEDYENLFNATVEPKPRFD